MSEQARLDHDRAMCDIERELWESVNRPVFCDLCGQTMCIYDWVTHQAIIHADKWWNPT